MAHVADFSALTPDVMLTAVEDGLAKPMTGLTHPLNSYINRVYELQARDGTRYIAKFYRPGRWQRAAVEQEHAFVLECAADEIPVAAPLRLAHGSTCGETAGILFAVYEKKLGRQLEPVADDDWRRLGHALGRLHAVGARHDAPARVTLHPAESTANDVAQILDGGFVSKRYEGEFRQVTRDILQRITPLFTDCEMIRIHGDCHSGNLLDRPGEGLLVIDFDDMAMGPPVQDLWMLLPEHANRARREVNLILDGYELFREFDDVSLRLIEPLRAMRILYFLDWCSRQYHDPKFRTNFADWGTDAFWAGEVSDLRRQVNVIREHLPGA